MNSSMQVYTTNAKFGWRIDADGMLRCKTNVLKTGVMDYAPSDFKDSELPEHLKRKGKIKLYVPPEELSKEESLKTLEGKPILVGHTWLEAGKNDSVGSVAGTPYYDDESGMLKADILITDKKARDRITKSDPTDKLVDQSAAYRNVVDWVPGRSPKGEAYDGIQRGLKYNHIALLPKGSGRAGEDVRILNQREKGLMSDFTGVRVGENTIRVMNEDVSVLENAITKIENKCHDKMEDMKKNADKEKEKTKNEMDEMSDELENEKKAHDKTKGEKEAMESRIKNELSSEALSQRLSEIVKERDEATKILNSLGSDEDTVKTINSKMGDDLRRACVQEYRLKNSMSDLPSDASEELVKGLFIGHYSEAISKNSSTTAGDKVVKTMNESSSAGVKEESLTYAQIMANRQKNYAEYRKNGI